MANVDLAARRRLWKGGCGQEQPVMEVLVVGQRQRFYLSSTLLHVVAPAAKKYIVEVHILLSWQPARAWGAAGKGSKAVWNAAWLRPEPEPSSAELSPEQLAQAAVQSGCTAGAARVFVALLDSDLRLDEVPDQMRWREATVLPLLRWRKVQLLWELLKSEASSSGNDYYLLIREDTEWVGDFNLSNFITGEVARRQVFAARMGGLCMAPDPHGRASDRVFLLGPEAEDDFLNLYSIYYDVADPALDDVEDVEEFIQRAATFKGIDLQVVDNAFFPFFLTLHMGLSESGRAVQCLRGPQQQDLEEPKSSCVQRDRLRHPLCQDLAKGNV
ncbi:unnamed protein product [Effrenium voratum]|uniref:Uncharacterized protein n=1 Tax=Effrenium voratum TaxID=2562239 RepID=A0AA36HVN0_9DINO|nr:unnamed protein product [Effrenium voratum]